MTSNREGARKAPSYKPQYGVIVLCRDEAHQAAVYEALKSQDHDCKIVVT